MNGGLGADGSGGGGDACEGEPVPAFSHPGEDPHVFRDQRGYYHMLFNALPYRYVSILLIAFVVVTSH